MYELNSFAFQFFPTISQTHEYGTGERQGDVDRGAAARKGPEARAGHEQRPLHLEAFPAWRQRHPHREESDRFGERRRRLERAALRSESEQQQFSVALHCTHWSVLSPIGLLTSISVASRLRSRHFVFFLASIESAEPRLLCICSLPAHRIDSLVYFKFKTRSHFVYASF